MTIDQRLMAARMREHARGHGLCGKILSDCHICILERGHDEGVHDRGWEVTTHVLPDPYARDSRDSITEHRISDGMRHFRTGSLDDAKWLASTLSRLEL